MKNRSLYRLLDANINRATEGIRVIEDAYRFIYEDKKKFCVFRGLRHKIGEITQKEYPALVSSRDSREDSGRKIAEPGRENFKGLLAANFKRSQQAVRVLEEYSKLFSAKAGSEFKKIRFKLYTLEKKCMADVSGKIK
ncbi:MAG: hypothetical protein A2297_02965 [Elusimicrobia bacterium RIFOXYB2_FULL_48_7]|nr:MAG: hypothetical protein A2297_02965 [Elusimicrobia bacterium RIFOXYB2_FULL_48_7]